MKKIAEGLQYRVFDLGNGRILKRAQTFSGKVRVLKKWNKNNKDYQIFNARREAEAVQKITEYSINNLRKNRNKIDFKLIGNPKFLKGLGYEQDKIKIISELLPQITPEKSKQIVDKYVRCLIEMWKCGFSDTIFNFTINYGVDKHGKVALADLGEVTFSKEKIKKLVKKKKWLEQWSYTAMKNSKLKVYYAKKSQEVLTLRNLDKYWKKSN